MRVLCYLLDGDTNASSYHRVLQYLPLLRAQGIAGDVSRPVPPWLYERLVEGGAFSPPRKLAFYSLFLLLRLLDVLRAGVYDVVLVQRDLFPFGPPVLERTLRVVRSRLVYDTDDPVYLKPSFTPKTPFQRLRRLDKVAEVVRHARAVTAATEPIAAWARRLNADVTVLPMALDPQPYEEARARASGPTNGRPVILGWSGTGGSVQYLESLAPALAELAKRRPILVRAISGASATIKLPGVPLETRLWRQESVLDDLAGADVGLVPLHDLPFEREKFPFKVLQYMALRLPVVAASVGTIQDVLRHGENGFLVGAPGEWVETLDRLAGDSALRARIGEAGYATLLDRFTTERVAPALGAVLRRAASG